MIDVVYDNVIALLGKEKDLNENERILIEFAIEDAENKIKNYCNFDEVPAALQTVLARLSVDVYRAEGYGSEDNRQVNSVSRGDVSTSFADTSNLESTQTDFMSKYKAQLNSFRRLRW